MAASTGTLSLLALRKERFQSVRAFGLDVIQRVIEADLAAHNAIVADMFAELAETTADSQRLAGSSDAMQMYQGDEYSESPSQLVGQGTTVGFPLRLWQIELGWTRKYFEQATPADMAEQVIGAQKAHAKMLVRQMKRAFFKATNFTFFDNLVVPRINLAVKRFVNADGDLIPDGPYGETFDGSSHTHYTAHNGLQASDVTALVNTVVEHGHGNKVRIAISPTDETAFRALTGFVAYVDGRLILNQSANQPTTRLDITRINDRPIGVFGAAGLLGAAEGGVRGRRRGVPRQAARERGRRPPAAA
jgi:hypothetical protein